jgi:hypothetical protein
MADTEARSTVFGLFFFGREMVSGIAEHKAVLGFK